MSKRHASRPDDVTVTFRRMRFDFEDTGFARYWHDDSPFITTFWDALSQAFPSGEKFFIDAVRDVRGELDPEKDCALLQEMEEFVRQEAHHTTQHRKFNRLVGEQGYDVTKMEQRYQRTLDNVRRILDTRGMLAVTMALEHFTAGFAHQYLTNPELSRGADPRVVALWAWHAAEEAEHKSTAFDVYDRLGGGYLRRVTVLGTAWFLIIYLTLRNQHDMLVRDSKRWNLRDNLRGLRYLLGRRGLVSSMLPSFLAYYRPGFHPWQDDDAHLIAQWRERNARYIETEGGKALASVAA